MKLLRIVVAVVLAATLAGCVKNEAEFEQFRTALRKRPDIQANGLAKCTTRVTYFDIETRRMMANYARLRLDDRMPATVCRRLLSGYLGGKMKWADYQGIVSRSRQRITPTMARIIRGG